MSTVSFHNFKSQNFNISSSESHQNLTGTSSECHQNFKLISNWSTLNKGDNHNSAFPQTPGSQNFLAWPRFRTKTSHNRTEGLWGPPATVSFHNFKSQNFKLSVSNPESKYVAYVSVLSQISSCQGLGRKNKFEVLKTDRKDLSTFRKGGCSGNRV